MLVIFTIDIPVEKYILKNRVQDRGMLNTKELIPALQNASYEGESNENRKYFLSRSLLNTKGTQ